MVKAVIGEETRLSSAEDRLSRSAIPAQVGLVIGKLSAVLDRGFVFDLIPTPKNDAGESACSVLETKDERRKTSKSKSQSSDSSSLTVDIDWVAEHARQVSRMLTGGVKVIGIYIWASDSACKSSSMVLCQTIKGVVEATREFDYDSDEALLIHICYSPRRWNCRTCALSSNITSSLRPCDFKMGRVLSSLQKFRCNYNFDLRLPVFNGGASNRQTFSDVLHQELLGHAKALRSAKAMIDGNLGVSDEPCSTDGEHEIELFLPFLKDACAEACSIKEVIGTLLFSGSICSYAYLNPKEPISQAVSDIKADIIRSLRSRLDIICDEVYEEDLGSPDGDIKEGDDGSMSKRSASELVLSQSRKSCSLPFPRRVYVPWLAGTFICDYLQPSESVEVLKEHCADLMSMETLPDSLKNCEQETEAAASSTTKSFWEAVAPSHLISSSSSSRSVEETAEAERSSKSGKTNLGILAALLFLAISIILGFWLRVRA